MSGDYMTSLECFTVLENCSDTISASDKTDLIARLRMAMAQYDSPLQKLTEELISVLRQ
jgi:hypothetical protein